MHTKETLASYKMLEPQGDDLLGVSKYCNEISIRFEGCVEYGKLQFLRIQKGRGTREQIQRVSRKEIIEEMKSVEFNNKKITGLYVNFQLKETSPEDSEKSFPF